MISAISSILGSVSVQRAQSIGAPEPQPREQEERQKKASIPSVEVTAAQSQAFSARVGDFLVNKASQSTDSTSAVSGSTGADGMPPAGAPVGGPPPGPASGGPQGDGQNSEARSGSAASILSLLAGGDGTSQSEAESDGDRAEADFARSSNVSRGANAQYALQQNGAGVFGVQFDDIGAYRFASGGA